MVKTISLSDDGDKNDKIDKEIADPALEKFIRDRITFLRLNKNVSERKMSEDLGAGRSYINAIASGKALPKMRSFIKICKYFDISPAEFFDLDVKYPDLLHEAINVIKVLEPPDIVMITNLATRIIVQMETTEMERK